CRARPAIGRALRPAICLRHSVAVGLSSHGGEPASLPDIHPAAVWDGAALVQWPVALRSESAPAPRFCAGPVSVSGRVGCTVGREPLPALAGLRARSRNNAACLPCSAARAPCTAALG